MEWIDTSKDHFVNINYITKDHYKWVEKNNCPQEPFLVAIKVFNNKTNQTRWDKHLVILTEYGLEEVADGETYPLGWEVTDVSYWCKIENPEVL